MALKIDLPSALRPKIEADLTRLQAQRVGAGQAVAALQTEIHGLESTQAGLTQRMVALSLQAIVSDSAAQELSNVERRAVAIRQRLDQLRAKVLPAIDLEITFGVLFEIVFHYQAALKSLLLSYLSPWGVVESDLPVIALKIDAFHALTDVSNWISTAPTPTSHNIGRIVSIYTRALHGEIDLSRVTASTLEQSPTTP